ncbi:hypothetical protein OIN60_00845 [Paenibacillus sp. P96]|uniref:Uncharacterized protein n=1 Tax=Paenibacillus zeirhizosphaerae TaxID=2987519 RepID=A0ABT9FKT3_9BACL|nr:hypothetical protein [Paenibacillus sp. P96]MDP4095339.1 hypothetical protein [Paenibacillus sp. P96]
MKKTIYKKWWFWVIIILFVGAIANLKTEETEIVPNETVSTSPVSNEPEKQTQVEDTGNTEKTEKNVESPNQSEAASNWVGIGADLTAFEEKFGAPSNASDDLFTNYSNDKYSCMAVDNKCINLTINTEASNIDEAIVEINTMSPTDAKVIQRYELKEDDTDYLRTIIVYRSEILKNNFEQSLFGDAEPGTFIAIIKSNQTEGIFATVLGLGDNP